jgi:hypothetical protein
MLAELGEIETEMEAEPGELVFVPAAGEVLPQLDCRSARNGRQSSDNRRMVSFRSAWNRRNTSMKRRKGANNWPEVHIQCREALSCGVVIDSTSVSS